MNTTMNRAQGLYDPRFEHDSCGVGFIATINGKASHQVVSDGLTILKKLVHRGAVGGDNKTGDGAGILVQIPHSFFEKVIPELGFSLPAVGSYGVGSLFLPVDRSLRDKYEADFSSIVQKEGGKILGWRNVPIAPDCLGEIALSAMPFIRQVFLSVEGLSGDALERKLYIIRKCAERYFLEMKVHQDSFYICSLSSKTIIYKGMFLGPQVEEFYPDLSDQKFQSAIALVHARYSTNTFPSWPLAQPFRMMAHNGEINTLRGNINAMKAREGSLSSDLFGEEIRKLSPIIMPEGSDSAMFDNTLELLVAAGRSPEHAMMMMVPEPFGPKFHISADKRSFYEYHAAIMEPWDGPAAIAFTDGTVIGASLDRNGLRPARYTITRSGSMVLASETGVLDISADDVLEKGILGPGKMILVDTKTGRVKKDNEIKASISRRRLYRRWLDENRIELKGLFEAPKPVSIDADQLTIKQAAFGYTQEDLSMVIIPMAQAGQEPIGSMGDDEAPAILSDRPQLLSRYFKQVFAQVTNPPIDPYRENLVMSLMSYIGKEQNLLAETPLHCHQLKLNHPVLTNEDTDRLIRCNESDFKAVVVPSLFPVKEGAAGLEPAVERLCKEVEAKVDEGFSMVILSDKAIDPENAPIPALLAVAAVHNHLIRVNKRHLVGLVIQTGEAKEIMDFATLIGFGVSAINPYLAFETLAGIKLSSAAFEKMTMEQAIDNYINAVKKGILKVMSKMGISTIRSYRGAQIFEAIGLDSSLVEKYFPGVPSRIGGAGLDVIANETLQRHRRAEGLDRNVTGLEIGGHYRFRRNSEKHLMSPETIVLLQKCVRTGSYETYKKFANTIDEQSSNLCTLRGLFSFKPGKPVPIDEVEPATSIVKRFVSSAMSFGSISKEAHETMAIAMNRLGAQSNSGEGGESEERYTPNWDMETSMSKVKQVASGRFGVTSDYLVHAKELQIKMAQGAKPGEGGQLPGHKVNPVIAKVRHSTPGVMLISPPPHHDIYSIEDLAQLIHDLKNASDGARVSVKLVSEAGVGTVAAGVAKGKADMVLISGGDGGTGASPLSSIKGAGMPWEVGLSETQQTLVLNGLRNKIRVQTDGQLRTGRDVVIAALLGAEEFGFGTISLMTLGCVLMRKCHLNTCPVGIATQDGKLRKRFNGKPEYIINYMMFVAQDVRERMAELGFRTIDEMVGQADRLEIGKAIGHWKTKGLDFSRIFVKPELPPGGAYRCTTGQQPFVMSLIDDNMIDNSRPALENKQPVKLFTQIKNSDRSVGAKLSAAISKRYGAAGLPQDTISCRFAGAAGQSFGAFLAPGVTFELEGEANDYVGKGLSGGRIIIYPQRGSLYRSQNNIIVGNVCLFGATSGEAFIHGMAGERFAVRNSGVNTVVEGVGDHGCEYMTGGRVVILGKTGVNFGAGMSGGIAYVLDENQLFDTHCNLEMVDLEPVTNNEDAAFLHDIISRHVKYTGSKHAEQILKDWNEMLPLFVKVFPIDYKKALERMKTSEGTKSEVMTITEEVWRRHG